MHIDWATLADDRGRRGRRRPDRRPARRVRARRVVRPLGPAGRRPDDGGASGTRPAVGMAVAVLCVLAAGLIVGYGLYLIIA